MHGPPRGASRLVARLSRCRSPGEAEEVLQKLRAARVLSSAGECTAAAAELGLRALWRQAVSVLADAQGAGLCPDAVFLGAVAGACGRGRQWELAASLLEGVLHRRPASQGGVVAANILVSACGKARQWQRAVSTLWGLQAKWISPDVVTFDAAAGACRDAHAWQMALVLLQAHVAAST